MCLMDYGYYQVNFCWRFPINLRIYGVLMLQQGLVVPVALTLQLNSQGIFQESYTLRSPEQAVVTDRFVPLSSSVIFFAFLSRRGWF